MAKGQTGPSHSVPWPEPWVRKPGGRGVRAVVRPKGALKPAGSVNWVKARIRSHGVFVGEFEVPGDEADLPRGSWRGSRRAIVGRRNGDFYPREYFGRRI